MEVGTIKVVETRNENMNKTDKIEIIGGTDNSNEDAKIDGDIMRGGLQYFYFSWLLHDKPQEAFFKFKSDQ